MQPLSGSMIFFLGWLAGILTVIFAAGILTVIFAAWIDTR